MHLRKQPEKHRGKGKALIHLLKANSLSIHCFGFNLSLHFSCYMLNGNLAFDYEGWDHHWRPHDYAEWCSCTIVMQPQELLHCMGMNPEGVSVVVPRCSQSWLLENLIQCLGMPDLLSTLGAPGLYSGLRQAMP